MLAFAPNVEIAGVKYSASDNVFFQSNYSVAEKMLEYVTELSVQFDPDIVPVMISIIADGTIYKL